ncbi:MAG: hypothetical protein LBT08_07330 [Synergistaceae bacterium]|jgi:hypothetical protein|nr:hypothetical protein [Synergistaceae bacterium]
MATTASKRDVLLEFDGNLPKNRVIVDKIRKEGVLGVMFNKDDFMAAVKWATNLAYGYKDFYAPHKDRMVIPLSDLPFLKQDLVQAHLIMINYYKAKDNLEQVESMKSSLITLAKFQEVAEEDMETMRLWDEYMLASKQTLDVEAFGRYDMGALRGKGHLYERFSKLVAKEIGKFEAEVGRAVL